MNRGERGLVLLAAFLVGAFVAALAAGAADALGRHGWFSNGSNLIQWLSAPGLFAAITVAAWHRWTRRCAVPLCVRTGEHRVGGTLERVCHYHHTEDAHARVHRHHGRAHRLSGRLGWNETPTLPAADIESDA
jgi:hypothetical protein